MDKLLMGIGLVGMVLGILSPIFRVLKKQTRRSKIQVIITVSSFFLFVVGVIIGLI
ncbi:hypothetical protein [Alkaliphilus pronyensis]|uniref:hypothetical protein n=1 Tax=Alkaliphilus pronyensis TaxID=1482732 RepID=UPI001865843B|nr:hypothetical protein [Alkaliphilus pronyensis]